MRPSGLDVGIEGAAPGHVGEMPHLRIEGCPKSRQYYEFAKLASADVVARTEGTVVIATYYTMFVGGFNPDVEPICGLHIGEGGLGWLVWRPGFAEDDHFGYLGAGGRV